MTETDSSFLDSRGTKTHTGASELSSFLLKFNNILIGLRIN